MVEHTIATESVATVDKILPLFLSAENTLGLTGTSLSQSLTFGQLLLLFI